MVSTEKGPTQVRTIAQYIDGYTGDDGYMQPDGSRGVYYIISSPNRLPFAGNSQASLYDISAFASASSTTLYYMCGYYVAGLVFENWTSRGAPSLTPPSGHTLSNITIQAIK
jgi:hypothetical protein